MSDFHKLLIVQFALGALLIVLSCVGFFFILLYSSGCSPTSASESRAVSVEYARQARVRREARCQEMFEEGDIADMREWCNNLGLRLRESSRQHACELVSAYESLCPEVSGN